MNRIFDISRDLAADKAAKDYMEGGIFTYNFTTGQFDTEPAGHIEFIFPADEQAFNEQDNNARLVIDNLQMTTVIVRRLSRRGAIIG